MRVKRYWWKFVTGEVGVGCVSPARAPLNYVFATCTTLYGQYCRSATYLGVSTAGWFIARHTPACWALCKFGQSGAYIVVEEDVGIVWIIATDSEYVTVKCFRGVDEGKIKKALQQAAKGSGPAKLIGIRGVGGSKIKAEVVKVIPPT